MHFFLTYQILPPFLPKLTGSNTTLNGEHNGSYPFLPHRNTQHNGHKYRYKYFILNILHRHSCIPPITSQLSYNDDIAAYLRVFAHKTEQKRAMGRKNGSFMALIHICL